MLDFIPATSFDSRFIAEGFHMAMLMEDTDEERLCQFADKVCSRDDVLYCARNTIVAVLDGKYAGMVTAYDGRHYAAMRDNTFSIIKKEFGIDFPGMEDEAVPGEYYIDSLAVWPEYRGQGIGRKLLQHAIAEGQQLGLTVTLAVDPVNTNAQKLYESLGFRYCSDLFIFGHTYYKMCISK